jgi:hypothetical protein
VLEVSEIIIFGGEFYSIYFEFWIDGREDGGSRVGRFDVRAENILEGGCFIRLWVLG